MSKQITIRGKQLFVEFAKQVSQERFDELFAHLKPSVRLEAWNELLKAVKREEQPQPKETPKQKQPKRTAKRRIKKAD